MNIMDTDRSCVLLNDRAYLPANTNCVELMKLANELDNLDDEYSTVFELNALYLYYRGVGMRSSVVNILKQIQVNDSCIVGVGNSDMRLTRVSKHFYAGEWVNMHKNYREVSYSMHTCREHEAEELLCN